MGRVVKLRGPSLREVKQRINALPVRLAETVASDVAPTLTGFVQSDYSAGRTVYGDARPAHPSTGRVPDLNPGGRTQQSLRFASVGSVVRARLTYPWVKYLIGWFRIMPVGDRSAIPLKWKRAIDQSVARAVDQILGSKAA